MSRIISTLCISLMATALCFGGPKVTIQKKTSHNEERNVSQHEEKNEKKAVPRDEGKNARSEGARVIIKMQKYHVPQPNKKLPDQRHITRNKQQIDMPDRDGRGARITQQRTALPPQQHTSIVRNQNIIRNIEREQRVEIKPNRYYWHERDGVRYAHYYDRKVHWYGFYHGPHFYWTRYYRGYWWWFDVHFSRWVYWWNDYWWWLSPGGVAHVYIDNSYYPYRESGVMIKKPYVEAPPSAIPSRTEGATYYSPDNQRMVQVSGSPSEAFLYDTSYRKPMFIKYLGQEVDKVRFSGGKAGMSLQILVDYLDGSFALFTEEGEPIDAAVEDLTCDPPLTAPGSLPPVPPSPGN